MTRLVWVAVGAVAGSLTCHIYRRRVRAGSRLRARDRFGSSTSRWTEQDHRNYARWQRRVECGLTARDAGNRALTALTFGLYRAEDLTG